MVMDFYDSLSKTALIELAFTLTKESSYMFQEMNYLFTLFSPFHLLHMAGNVHYRPNRDLLYCILCLLKITLVVAKIYFSPWKKHQCRARMSPAGIIFQNADRISDCQHLQLFTGGLFLAWTACPACTGQDGSARE